MGPLPLKPILWKLSSKVILVCMVTGGSLHRGFNRQSLCGHGLRYNGGANLRSLRDHVLKLFGYSEMLPYKYHTEV